MTVCVVRLVQVLARSNKLGRISLKKLHTGSPSPPPLEMPSQIQDAINQQIGMELDASLNYLDMSARFSSTTLALRGATNMFLCNSKEETKHAHLLIEWLVLRGGTLRLCPRKINVTECSMQPLSSPSEGAWCALNHAVQTALSMEEEATQSLLNLHDLSERCKDITTAKFISETFLTEQMESLYKLSELLTRLRRVEDSPAGLLLIDEMLYKTYQKCQNKIQE